MKTGMKQRVSRVVRAIGACGALSCAMIGFAAVNPDPASAQAAKRMFGGVDNPAPLESRALGSYARGCLAGGQALPVDGPYWQAMRLERNRNWGHPDLVALLQRLATDAATLDGWPGLLVGDLAQPAGGPMLTGHNSHQIGLDADIWLRPMPDRRLSRQERRDMSAISMLKKGTMKVDPNVWTMTHARLIRRAASYPQTARIFVNPGIKRALCSVNWDDRSWLRKVRAWGGHHYHFHIRISCPAGSVGCVNQDPPPAGDGCGAELDAWFKPPDPNKPKRRRQPRPELTLTDLPRECTNVLQAAGGRMTFGARAQDPGAVILPNQAPLPPRRTFQ
jgi:penicillin-insensitive murein endopeptidase